MEREFIQWLRSWLDAPPNVELGIGDDAAVLSLAAGAQLVVSTDLLLDGVHFELARVNPRRAGRKCLAVNLSDLAAMAAKPLAAFVSLAVPRLGGLPLAQALYEGMMPLAHEFQVALAGGDTNSWNESLVVSVTVLGVAGERGPLIRGGAVAGDEILVTGHFGGSILGRHLDFTPRVNEAILLHERYALHAGIDVSDGLALDLSRVGQESRCGACLDLDAIPISPEARRLAEQDGRTALEHALGDGEDFELALAVPPDVAEQMLADQPLDVPLSRIGKFIDEPGLWRTTPTGRAPLEATGYQHQ